MKTRFLSLFLLAGVLGGCDLMSLEEKPTTFLSDQQFFRNEADADAAVKAAYEPFRHTDYYNWWFVGMVEMHSDYMNGRGSQAPIGRYDFDPVSIQRIGFVWNVIYRSVNRANLVLERVPSIEMDATRKAQMLGEAHFIRGLDYFNLVRLWGPVPLRTTPSAGLTELAAPRASEEEIYSLILSDLEAAESNLPDMASEIGRATRWAAKMVLANVYLTREGWSRAAAKAKEVIDSGQFALLRVEESGDFDQMFGPDVVTHPEEIFSIKYLRTAGLGTWLPTLLHHPQAGYSSGGFFAWPGEPASFLKDWDVKDLRRNFNLYSGDDERLLSSAVPILFKKYKDPLGDGNTGHGNDFPVFRYSEALLIFAEAESQAMGGPTPAAYEAVNQIRRRAYGLDPAVPNAEVDLTQGMSGSAFRDAVLQERAHEFVLEAKRWFDLLRTGTALEVIQGLGKPILPQHLQWPIPQGEIDNNEALTEADQNPGW